MTQTIAEQVRELNGDRPAQPPTGPMAVFAGELARLARTPVPDGAITPGTPIGDIELIDPHGGPVTLYGALGQCPAVLVFYRGQWCPYCNIALRTYQAGLLPELRERGFALVAVSPQAPDGSLTMKEKNELEFAVLSDPGNVLAGRLGIVTGPSSEVVHAQLSLGMDTVAGNADGTTAIPMPTTIVLGGDRVARWVDVHPDHTSRSEVAEILAAVDEVLAG